MKILIFIIIGVIIFGGGGIFIACLAAGGDKNGFIYNLNSTRIQILGF